MGFSVKPCRLKSGKCLQEELVSLLCSKQQDENDAGHHRGCKKSRFSKVPVWVCLRRWLTCSLRYKRSSCLPEAFLHRAGMRQEAGKGFCVGQREEQLPAGREMTLYEDDLLLFPVSPPPSLPTPSLASYSRLASFSLCRGWPWNSDPPPLLLGW